jgi:preprotein translocase subunit SecD
VLTLTLYGIVTFALFRLLGVTLTLPGIAGFILSVGVAVDGNTLIIERLKEELRHGRRLSTAVEVAFERAWTSIRDSNFATLITCGILFWFGNQFGASIVKGFAVTLGIGVFISLFSSVFVTRTFLHLFTDHFNFEGRSKLFGA